MKVRSRTVSPRVSKSRLRRVSSSCPSEGAWDKGAVRRNPIRTRCEDQPLNKAVDKEGRKRSRNAARTYHEPCCWSEPDLDKVWKQAVMTPYY